MSLFTPEQLGECLLKQDGKSIQTNSKQNNFICEYSQKLDEAIPKITNGIYHYVSCGAWSTHDIIFKIISEHGPIKLTGATWSVATQTVDKFIKLFNEKKILKMDFLFDWRVQVRSPEAYSMLKYTDICNFKVASCHAKVAICEAENFSCVIIGSANFTKNPRIEAGIIDCNREAVEFHKKWITSEIQGSKPFGIDTRTLKSDGRK